MRIATILAWLTAAFVTQATRADGPADNRVDQVRPIPPPGIAVPEADRAALESGLARLQQQIDALRKSKQPLVRDHLPDVEVFHRAVRVALAHGEFFAPGEIAAAKEQLQTGLTRAEQLAAGQAPWTKQAGLVVIGYVSRLDRTVQPCGLVVPTTYEFTGRGRHRLDVWLHGRGEKLSEVAFLQQRMKQVGSISPADSIVLHPYGRYSNAFKFAGEVDVFEALEAVQRRYRVDPDRIAMRGFSMGGAGCWQFAVHYPDRWFAANPGAGFSETPEFLKSFQQETLAPSWFERTLWRWYDCPGYSANLLHCPTVAYSGELDIQKQAADVMEQALAQEHVPLLHLIGPQTKHAIHPESAAEIERRLASLAERGRDRLPREVQFVTYTLRYNRQHWLTINGLERHWEAARVRATLQGDGVSVATQNVSGFSLAFPAGWCPFPLGQKVAVDVDGQRIVTDGPRSDRSWSFHWWRGRVRADAEPDGPGLHKRPGLQGPIDDAFLDTFLVVRPTGTARHEAVGRWTASELEHCLVHWRRHFRGDALVKDDTAVTDDDVRDAHLILFGDPGSNAVLRRIANRLPIGWTDAAVTVADATFAAAHHAPVLVHPNPLNPRRYVVLNSGFTFREYDYLNNARQTPKLPDWAVIDVRTPANSRFPGRIAAADFFDERWQLRPTKE